MINQRTRFYSTTIICRAVVLLLSTLTLAQADGAFRIQLHSEVAVRGQMVRLKDVATIESQNVELMKQLEHVEIVRSPLVGQTRWVLLEQIQRSLKRHGFNPREVQWVSSGPIKVVRKTVKLTADKIRDAVEHHIRSHAPWDPEQLKIRSIKFKHNLDVPPGKVVLSVQTPKHSDWLGAVLFSVNIKVDGRLSQKVSVPANIEVWSDVVIAAKPLGKFEPITAQSIKVVKKNLSHVPANTILNADEIIGQRTKRNIAINSVMRSDQIEMPPLVKRGDLVQAVATSSSLKISVQAVVKEKGGKGEMIRVLNLRSKKIIYAQVIDAQTVSVDF